MYCYYTTFDSSLQWLFRQNQAKRWGKCTKKYIKYLRNIFKITNVTIDKGKKIVYYNK